tara:strand:- start:4266 stop:5162 length:897 start_codon:yes stop_codon:yes gene_type:complete
MSELKTLLEEKRKLVDKKATEYRQVRDDWNNRTKEHLTTRNNLNTEVRELIANVRTQRELREQKNEEVRDKKQRRSECNKVVRAAKDRLSELRGDSGDSRDEGHGHGRRGRRDKKVTVHSLRREFERLEREFEQGRHTGKNEIKVMDRLKKIRAQIQNMERSEEDNEELKEAREVLRKALESQEASHLEVTRAAEEAQQAHDLMIEWNEEVNRKREVAEEAHRKLRRSKKEADQAHHHYIVSIRCLHSTQQIIKAIQGIASGTAPEKSSSEGVQDLMSKLMSGETLSTEQLMELQRFE